jgi:hypothetical protein
MMEKHTPEPWTARKNTHDNGEWVVQAKPEAVADVETEADARRIAACVNACAGINPEAVPDLVRSLKWIVDCGDYGEGHRPACHDMRAEARKALAKAGKV